MNSNFLDFVAENDSEKAQESFSVMLQSKLADALEVRKVEIASTIVNEEPLEESINEADGRTVVDIHHPGHVYHGREAEVFHKHEDGRVNVQVRTGGEIDNYTLKPGQFKNMRYKKYPEPSAKNAENRRKNAEYYANQKKNEEFIAESDAARELVLHADNDEQLYRSSHQPIIKNLQRKKEKGIYDHDKATKLWGYHADRAAKSYHKAHGGGGGLPWHQMFTPDDRRIAAKHFAAQGRSELEEETVNEISDELAKKYLKKTGAGSIDRKIISATKNMADNPAFQKAKDKAMHRASTRLYGRAQAQEKLGLKKTDEAVARRGSPHLIQNIRRAAQVLKIKGINPQMAAQAHKEYTNLIGKNPKTPGYQLLRKMSAMKAQSIQNMQQGGVPLGGALEAKPADFNQALQRIKRF